VRGTPSLAEVQNGPDVTRSVKHAHDFKRLLEHPVEDQVALEPVYLPRANVAKLGILRKVGPPDFGLLGEEGVALLERAREAKRDLRPRLRGPPRGLSSSGPYLT